MVPHTVSCRPGHGGVANRQPHRAAWRRQHAIAKARKHLVKMEKGNALSWGNALGRNSGSSWKGLPGGVGRVVEPVGRGVDRVGRFELPDHLRKLCAAVDARYVLRREKDEIQRCITSGVRGQATDVGVTRHKMGAVKP
jgi:hypothetical protein